MSDLPNLDAARAALEATLLPASTSTTYRAIGECGHDLGYSSPIDNYNRDRPLWCSDCGGYAGIDDVRAVEMLNRADMSVDAAFLRDALAVVDALTARLAEAPAVVVTQGVGFTEERLRREEAERRLDEAYEYVERERDAARREGLEEAQRIAADLSGAYLEKHGGGGDYCAALGALTMALAAKVTP